MSVMLWYDPPQAVDAVGEILLSLSYLPTAERLTVVCAKCKNLVWTNSKNTAGQGTSICVLFLNVCERELPECLLLFVWTMNKSVCFWIPSKQNKMITDSVIIDSQCHLPEDMKTFIHIQTGRWDLNDLFITLNVQISASLTLYR